MNDKQKGKLETTLALAVWMGTWLDSAIRAFMMNEPTIGVIALVICAWIFTVISRRQKELFTSMEDNDVQENPVQR